MLSGIVRRKHFKTTDLQQAGNSTRQARGPATSGWHGVKRGVRGFVFVGLDRVFRRGHRCDKEEKIARALVSFRCCGRYIERIS